MIENRKFIARLQGGFFVPGVGPSSKCLRHAEGTGSKADSDKLSRVDAGNSTGGAYWFLSFRGIDHPISSIRYSSG
jgi:hypothetical protein